MDLPPDLITVSMLKTMLGEEFEPTATPFAFSLNQGDNTQLIQTMELVALTAELGWPNRFRH